MRTPLTGAYGIPDEKIKEGMRQIAARLQTRLIPRDDQPYLYRHYLEGSDTDETAFLLHKFVASDAEGEVHSHPWEWSISFILSGRYLEYRPAKSAFGKAPDTIVLSKPLERILVPGDFNVILGNDFHRVVLLTQDVWTLFLHGPRTKDWAFAKEKYDEEIPLRVIKTRTWSRPEENPEKP